MSAVPTYSHPAHLPAHLPALLRQSAQQHGSRPAIVDGDTTLTYADLLQRSEQVLPPLVQMRQQ